MVLGLYVVHPPGYILVVGHRLKIQTDYRIGTVDAADAVYRLFNRLLHNIFHMHTTVLYSYI